MHPPWSSRSETCCFLCQSFPLTGNELFFTLADCTEHVIKGATHGSVGAVDERKF